MTISRLVAGGGLALTLLLASGCSDSRQPETAPAAGPSSPATAASPTSPEEASPTPSPARTTAASSGDLTDGRHPARITHVDPSHGRITVDVVQLFIGAAAAQAARQDGSTDIPPPNDVWIRNTNPTLRTLPVTPAAPITVNVHGTAESGSSTTNIAKTLAQLADIGDLDSGIFWLTITDGQVIRIAEQYLP